MKSFQIWKRGRQALTNDCKPPSLSFPIWLMHIGGATNAQKYSLCTHVTTGPARSSWGACGPTRVGQGIEMNQTHPQSHQ